MRFRREKLLKNISERQLLNYRKEQGYAAFTYPRKELTINEMVQELYWHFSVSAHMSFGKSFDPVDYLNRVDVRRRIALDISRCLVTAKKLGEEIECSGATPDKIFNFMLADLSSHARCLSAKALRADFGYEYQEAAFTVYEEVTTLIRRLKLTRDGYEAIRALPGAVLCDTPKALPAAEESCKDSAETAKSEKTVRPERAIAPMPTSVNPAADEAEAKAEVAAPANTDDAEEANSKAEADHAEEEKSESTEKEEALLNRLDCKWKGARSEVPQPYELITPYGFDPEDDDEDWGLEDEDEDRNEAPVSGIPRNLWKELYLEENRISAELAAIRSQLETTGG